MLRMVKRGVTWAAALGLAGAGLLAASAPVSAAKKADTAIVLPGATSAEGIGAGPGNTFYAGDAFAGDIYRGDVRKGTAELFIDAPTGRNALGMKDDITNHLLFVAGGFTGHGYVYDTDTRVTVADYAFGTAGTSIINDVALVNGGAWFTDSLLPRLYFVPVSRQGTPGPVTTLTVTGPAADLTGAFNLNGIVATPNGQTLIVAHTGDSALYTVDPTTGASALISGASVPNVDGIMLRGHTLWAVQNFSNQISKFQLRPDLTSATLEGVITSPLFETPTTTAIFGDTLATVNAKFDTGFPPTATQYEVITTNAS